MTIKELIDNSKLTSYKINKDTGIPITTLEDWKKGKPANLSALKLVYYLSKDVNDLKENIEKLIKKEEP